MLRPKPGFACTLILTALVAACTDPLTEPRGEVARAFTILDAARGGSAGFYFLPPMVPAPGYSGTFDAAQSPVVVICELAGNVCGATVASFDAGEVKVDVVEEAYKVTWKTKGAGLDASKLYRIEVCVGTSVLGFADVMVLNNGNQIRTVDRNEYVASITGGTLNSRFRIETAAPPPPPPPPPPGGWQTVTWSRTRRTIGARSVRLQEIYSSVSSSMSTRAAYGLGYWVRAGFRRYGTTRKQFTISHRQRATRDR